MAEKRGVRLNRPQDVRRLLSRLVNESLRHEIENDQLRVISYTCGMILKSFEIGELADRIEKVEESIGGRP